MSRFSILITILILITLTLGGVWYWFFFKITPLKSVPFVANNKPSNFSPLNPNTTVPTPTNTSTTTSTSTETRVDNAPVDKLQVMKLYTTPVAYGITASSTASSTKVFFVDRGTGHTYSASMASNTPLKLSNTTIPRVYESYWDQNGHNAVLRYIKEGSDTITTLYSPIIPKKNPIFPVEIKAAYLSSNISTLTLSPKGDKMFTLEKNSSGSTGYISKIDGSTKTQVFESPLSEWIPSWPEENTVTLTTKASRLSPGYLYFLDIKKKDLKKILGPIYGLTTNTSKDTKRVYYSDITNANKVYSASDTSTQDTLFLTLPEKCVWSNKKKTSIYCAVPTEPQKNLPDAWNKGLTSSSDQIWHLDTVTGSVYKVANLLEKTGVSIDVINLVLDPKETNLFFLNKNDLSLWAVDLSE